VIRCVLLFVCVRASHILGSLDKPHISGVDKFFKTLAKLASSEEFSLAKSENNWPNI
jgi:hypothetical protein